MKLRIWRKGIAARLSYSNSDRSTVVLVLNEMVLVLVLDFPVPRVRERVLPFGRSTSTKTQANWNLTCKDTDNHRANANRLINQLNALDSKAFARQAFCR